MRRLFGRLLDVYALKKERKRQKAVKQTKRNVKFEFHIPFFAFIDYFIS